MSPHDESRLTAAVSRLLALIEHHELVRRFKADWTYSYRDGLRFEDQVEIVKDLLAEADRHG